MENPIGCGKKIRKCLRMKLKKKYLKKEKKIQANPGEPFKPRFIS